MRALRVVGAEVAHIGVDRHAADLGPSVNRQVRLGQQHDTGDAALTRLGGRREAMEQFANGGQPRFSHGRQAQRAQRRRLRHQRDVSKAVAQISGEVQALHRRIVAAFRPCPRQSRCRQGRVVEPSAGA